MVHVPLHQQEQFVRAIQRGVAIIVIHQRVQLVTKLLIKNVPVRESVWMESVNVVQVTPERIVAKKAVQMIAVVKVFVKIGHVNASMVMKAWRVIVNHVRLVVKNMVPAKMAHALALKVLPAMHVKN
jgi:hypothetical protein